MLVAGARASSANSSVKPVATQIAQRGPLAAFLRRQFNSLSEVENGRWRSSLGLDLSFPACESR
jgi:hypothetical protein